MLKRHSKLVVLLVMVTFLFSFIATAGASTFSDVTGTSAQSAAIYKLNSLGIINGYTDGTFKADNTITRAEFAKIAGYLAGLGSVAQGMQSAPSTFKDVNTSDWFNGAVNLAYAQGYVKGYPDGTFKPNAPVTQAEVVTVFMRILGYNDNLPGNWPADYIAKAANLGVLDDVTFASSAAATRGIVAVLGSATLDENVVSYKASDNVFEEAQKNNLPYTLLSDKFKDSASTSKVLVTAVSNGSDGYTLDTYNFATSTAKTSIDINKDVVVSGAASVFALEGAMVNYLTNDDGEITYIEVRDVKAPVFGKIDTISSTTTAGANIEIADTKYQLNEEGFFFTNGKVADSGLATTLNAAMAGGTVNTYVAVDAKVKLFFDGDGKVVFMSKTGVGRTLVVDSVDTKNGKIKTETSVTISDVSSDDDYLVLKNGAIMTLADVKAGDTIYSSQVRGFDRVITIVDRPITGKFEKYYANTAAATDDQVVIGGTTYDLAADNAQYGLYMVDNAGDEVTYANIGDLVGSDVNAKLDGNGEVAYISGTATDNGLYGVLMGGGIDQSKGDDTAWIKICNKDGKQIVLDFDTDYYDTAAEIAAINTALGGTLDATAGDVDVLLGRLVKYTLNSEGKIDSVKDANGISSITRAAGVAITISDAEKDHDRLDIDATAAYNWKYVDKNSVIFDAKNTGAYGAITAADPELATWADVEDTNNFTADIYYDGTTVKFVVLYAGAAGISDTGNDGVFVKSYNDGNDDYATFYIDGALKDYKVASAAGLVAGTIYTFDVSDDEASNIVANATVAAGTVSDVASDNFTTEDGNYIVTDKTMFVKMDGTSVDTLGEYGDVDETDQVVVLQDTGADTGIALIVVIK